jgi:DNA (cytosine-5)-methyltransferase 1
MDTLPARSPEALAKAKLKGGCKNLREEVHQWATPRTGATDSTRPNNKGGIPLGDQVKRDQAWATPKASDPQHAGPNMRDSAGNYALPAQVTKAWATPRLGGEEKAETRLARGKDIGLHGQVGAMTNNAKLNPRWVETLMGLPIGWTMPNCMSPVTIELTSCDCSEMESCPPPQPELF